MALRIRWKAAGKWAAIVIVGLLALQQRPKLLKPPATPTVPADVGLPHGVRPVRLPSAQVTEQGLPRRKLGRVVSGRGVPRRPKAAEGKAANRRARRPSARSSAK